MKKRKRRKKRKKKKEKRKKKEKKKEKRKKRKMENDLVESRRTISGRCKMKVSKSIDSHFQLMSVDRATKEHAWKDQRQWR